LRYDIDPTLAGRLEVSFTRTETGPTAYIALLNDSGSTSSGRSIVDMNISASAFSFRDQSVEIPAGLVPTPGTLQNVVITWTAATETERPVVNVSIDGVPIPEFTSGGSAYNADDANSGGIGGVERVQFRFGSNSGTTEATDTFTIKRFAVFAEVDGGTAIFADDFSSYTIGDSLDSDDNAASPYSGSSSEVVVEGIEVADEQAAPQVAVIRDTDAGDTGELRYDIDPTLAGRLDVSFTRTATGPTAYIALLNDSGSTSSGRSIVDMNISASAYSFRDQSVEIPAGLVPTPGTLQNVVITWTAATETERPVVNVSIDGVALPAFTSGGSAYNADDANSGGIGGVERVQFRFGSNSGTTEASDTFIINSFEVFADTEGTMSIFADDFSGYAVGDSLDSDNNAASPYSSSSSEVVVEVFE
jgi:hypothetical protein